MITLQSRVRSVDSEDITETSSGTSGTRSCSSDDDSDSGKSYRRKNKSKSKRKKVRSERSTKAGQSVLKPEIWPQSVLSLQYVSKGLKFDELDMPLFVAGFVEALEVDIKHGRVKMIDRKLRHLKSLMYTASFQNWDTILELHSAIVLDIERGNRKWGDSNLDIESKVVSSASVKLRQAYNSSRQGQLQGVTTGGSFKSNVTNVWFCRQYQSGKCDKGKSHVTFVSGKKRTVTHICAICWLTDKVQKEHAESSLECKYHGKTLDQARKLGKD